MGYSSGFVSATSRKELKPVLEQLFGDPRLVSSQMIDDIQKFKRLDGVDSALKSLAEGTFKTGRQQAIFHLDGTPAVAISGKKDQIILQRTRPTPKGSGSRSSKAPVTWSRWSKPARPMR